MWNNIQLAKRIVTSVAPRALFKSMMFGLKGINAVRRFEKRLAQGKQFPAFMMISVTNRCNLSCQGCWVSPTPPTDMTPELLKQIITDCRSQGGHFFGILGGEPLLHTGLLDTLSEFPGAYFQLFTNGHKLDATVAKRLRQMGNVTPLISIEGLETVADERRGSTNVAAKSLQAIEHCQRERLLTGVATSVCQSNFNQVVQRSFLEDLVARGVHYAWYYIYRPVGPNPAPELCLTSEQIRQLREFLVEARTWTPLIVVDTYWDADGQALCPAATGISYHITPNGHVEPCPILQCSCNQAVPDQSLVQEIEGSNFLKEFRSLASERTRGCILMVDPDKMKRFACEQGAIDSTGRDRVFEEWAAMSPTPSHDMGDTPIPERNPLYRFAKKHWFFGFGAYG